ncbi:MAG: hypothetical protein WDO13_16235 [Verrucomicrobiota bacterium]
MNPVAAPLTVHSLICHKHVDMALVCLSSFYRCSDRPVDLRLHDDGSITPEDAARLKAAFPTARLVMRKESDQLAAERLRALPKCLEFRGVTEMAFKLFDPLLMNREPFLLLDTDILFFNAFENLCDESAGGAVLTYMEDIRYSYSMMPLESLWHKELRPVRRLNAGMLFVRSGQIDLGYIEYVLKKFPHLGPMGGVTEQTLWGILATRLGARKWNPRQVSIVTPAFQPGADQVAAHFVTPARHRLGEFTNGTAYGSPGRRVRVPTEEATPYLPHHSVTALRDYLSIRLQNRLYLLRTAFRGAEKA